MIEKLLSLITQRVPLSSVDRAMCKKYFEPVSFQAHQVIEQAGKIPRYLYFVVSGYLRLFSYEIRGGVITTHLNCPPGFITSYASFKNRVASDDSLECITDCQLLRITLSDLNLLLSASPALKDFSATVFEQSLAYNELRAKDLASLSAEQRYEKLIQANPAVLLHVPVSYIASFLGMKPESLSRIRKTISSRRRAIS